MVDYEIGDDRAVIYLNGDGPIALEDMTDSFAALARIYGRHFEKSSGEKSPKLYISRLQSGSIEAEIVPLLMIVGATVPYMDGAIVVRDFTRWVATHVRVFAGWGTDESATAASPPTLSRDDAHDLREFIKPICGKKAAELGVKHARFRKTDGEREIIAEYDFEEGAINRAHVNLGKFIEAEADKEKEGSSQRRYAEVLMRWHQASAEAGKEKGRTGDRALIDAITEKPLPVYFPSQSQDLIRRMAQDEPHIFKKGYIVDVMVDLVEGEPKLYRIMTLHGVVDLDD
jgi:hypothetical protein